MKHLTASWGGAFAGRSVPHVPQTHEYVAHSLRLGFSGNQLRRIVALRKDGESWAFIAKTVLSNAGAVKAAWEGLPIALR